MNLIEALQTVPDYRHARGKRHPLWIILVFIVMGNLAGYRGNRPLEEFAQRYGSEVADLLQIDLDAVPSFSTFRRAHIGLDFAALSDAFVQWMRQYLTVDEDVYAIDGKRIRQPITDDDGKTRFVGLVSVFAQAQGITVDLAALTPTDNSELKVVQYLLEKLHLSGVAFSLDALHAQKNTVAHC
ncbi:MAG: ISAs1 family transposase [Leptolyngbya sp. SIOISBB]|nr:ISAs1 family transposase [Leptolyngbya sp. SIOISBB]NEQ43355.1 ISAs1 family transposase [Leptolyngbya sp. SIOISBB]NEQ43783.1 ISAs1 family transposase [Leptolyngbya sp. SIOISBB]NEQ47098.1 ISAs1 family transposase [Leptolyngbya sp. SIOISBB]